MGLSGVSFGEIMLVLLVVLLLFGSKKLPNIASDLGTALRDFRRAMSSEPAGKGKGEGTQRDRESSRDKAT